MLPWQDSSYFPSWNIEDVIPSRDPWNESQKFPPFSRIMGVNKMKGSWNIMKSGHQIPSRKNYGICSYSCMLNTHKNQWWNTSTYPTFIHRHKFHHMKRLLGWGFECLSASIKTPSKITSHAQQLKHKSWGWEGMLWPSYIYFTQDLEGENVHLCDFEDLTLD